LDVGGRKCTPLREMAVVGNTPPLLLCSMFLGPLL
jgi:hypothetical protein